VRFSGGSWGRRMACGRRGGVCRRLGVCRLLILMAAAWQLGLFLESLQSSRNLQPNTAQQQVSPWDDARKQRRFFLSFFSLLRSALRWTHLEFITLLFGLSHSLTHFRVLSFATPMTTQSRRAAINLRRVFCCHGWFRGYVSVENGQDFFIS